MAKHLIPRPRHANMVKRKGGHFSINTHHLKRVEGSNKYCGPAIISAITGCKTNQAALLLKSIKPSRYLTNDDGDAYANCALVYREDLIEALKWSGMYYDGSFPMHKHNIKTLGDVMSMVHMGTMPHNRVFLVRTTNHWVTICDGRFCDNNWLGYTKYKVSKGPRCTRNPTKAGDWLKAQHQVKSIDVFYRTADVKVELPELPVINPRIGPDVSLLEFFQGKATTFAKQSMGFHLITLVELHKVQYFYSFASTYEDIMAYGHEILEKLQIAAPRRRMVDQLFVMCFYDMLDAVITPTLAFESRYSKIVNTIFMPEDPWVSQTEGVFFDAWMFRAAEFNFSEDNWVARLIGALHTVAHPGEFNDSDISFAKGTILGCVDKCKQLKKDMQYFNLTMYKDQRVKKLRMHQYLINVPEIVYANDNA